MNILRQTAEMWKYRPVPEKPEPHEEYDSQYARLPGGVIMGARVRGKKHKHEGTNCDDWFEIGFSGNWTVIAVSDGAGSKKFSRIGARQSCQVAVNHITTALDEIENIKFEFTKNLALALDSKEFSKSCGYLAMVLQNSVKKVFSSIETACEMRQHSDAHLEFLGREPEVSDFYATLLISLIVPVETENVIITLQIGDGAIFAIDSKADYKIASRSLSEAEVKGSFAGETEFLTQKILENLITKTRVYRGTADTVMVMTDGVSDDYFPYDEGAKRLYLDLLANMVITNRKRLTKENADKIALKIPRPITFPWVNDPSVKVSLQYVSAILERMSCPLSYIWDNLGILSYYSRYISLPKIKDRGERLQKWLDNYTQRGSFDDRTLVIFTVNDEE